MSENKKQKQPDQNVVGNSTARNIPQSSRRRLLKSTAAIPVIMTLHSGAAMARSSNLAGAEISVHEDVAGTDSDVFCASHEGQLEGGAYDLGETPSYTRIPRQKEGGVERTPDEIMQACENQGGIFISSGAFNSIGSRTGWTEI
ncbi:hypothetical protein ABO04_02190 [Nitrosomonas sp. HPC101]|uniref:hypothetical protein n=1 Tax=Nitrosomonas sp. HPC101 TaxID=1658667 RepID=UPI00136A8B05|nr:hypothetical protein [Nitrosomonas sp. HPC101]MXS84753.1 hypothetical protein [Nitrosomonas sp. HPC101]